MKILIAYDGSIPAAIALENLSRAGLAANAQAIVVSVVEEGITAPRSYGMIETDFAGRRVAVAEKWADEACNRLTGQFPNWDVQMETRWGHPAAIILEKAIAWPADLIVVGTHGRSTLGRLILGSVSMKLVREAPCTVRVGRAGKYENPIRLLVGCDGSSEAEKAVDEIYRRSWPAGTEVRILAVNEVLTPVNAERIANSGEPFGDINAAELCRLDAASEKAARKLRSAGLVVSSIVEEGDAKEVLVDTARHWKADTIFLGARGLGRVERFFLGSVSSATVAQAPCAVEVVRLR